jgi:hypothetical protein
MDTTQAKLLGPLLAETSVTDPDPGSGIRCLFDPLDPGSGMGKKSGSGSAIHNLIWVKIPYLNSLMRIRDLGWKKFGSGMENIRIRINIPDPHTGRNIFSSK